MMVQPLAWRFHKDLRAALSCPTASATVHGRSSNRDLLESVKQHRFYGVTTGEDSNQD